MELFVVKNITSKEVLGKFSSKVEAKQARNELKTKAPGEIFIVSPGKDHPRCK